MTLYYFQVIGKEMLLYLINNTELFTNKNENIRNKNKKPNKKKFVNSDSIFASSLKNKIFFTSNIDLILSINNIKLFLNNIKYHYI